MRRIVRFADGETLSFEVRVAPRSRRIQLKLTPEAGLIVCVPRGAADTRVDAVVRGKQAWIARHLRRFDALQQALPPHLTAALPEVLVLEALGETWHIEYRSTPAPATRVRRSGPGHLCVAGQVDDPAHCQAALRRWLARRGREVLLPWLARLSADTGLHYRRAGVRGQRTRWGSCSAGGVISLNFKLLFLPPEFVRHTLIHELCHTRELNHGLRFRRLVAQHDPGGGRSRVALEEVWRYVPGWCH